MNVQIESFKKELAELLDKYGFTISCTYEGDTHGIYDEYMTISDNKTNQELFRIESQSYISASDLK